MSRRHLEPDLSVSLFPFLAVLVCAMGALILLLLIITRNIRAEAILAAVSVSSKEKAAPISKSLLPIIRATQMEISASTAPAMLPRPKERDSFTATPESLFAFDPQSFPEQKQKTYSRIDFLSAEKKRLAENLALRKKNQKKIASLSNRVQQEERNSRQLKTHFASLSNQKKELSNQLAMQKLSPGKKAEELAGLQDRLNQKQQEIKDQKKNAANLLGKLQIVTYDGTTGVNRKPIFLECNAGKVVFQPDQVEVTLKELEAGAPPTHPLGLAVRQLAAYRNQLREIKQPAYVLLIVRPEGINEFYACRRILASQNITFGYELVGKKQEFYFEQADFKAKKVITDAMLSARNQWVQKPGTEENGTTGNVKRTPQNRLSGFPGFGQENQLRKKTYSNRKNPDSKNRVLQPFPRKDPKSLNHEKRHTADVKNQLNKTLTQNNSSQNSQQQSPLLRSLSSRAKRLSRGAPDLLISFERQVKVAISPDSIEVGSQEPVAISLAEDELLTQQKFLKILEQQMLQWGPAPDGFRWVPGFQLVVSPGGNQIAFRIEAIAKELNLNSKTKFALESAKQNSRVRRK